MRRTGIRTLLACPSCRYPLIPRAGETVLTFYCSGGHVFLLSELLSAPSDLLRTGLEAMMADWERQQEALRTTALEARRNGCLDVADLFTRQGRRLGSRIDLMRQALMPASTV